MEFTCPAHGTEPGHLDLSRGNTRLQQYPAVGFSQIDMSLVVEINPLREDLFEPRGDFRSHLETTGADSGPDRRPNIFGLCAKLTHHVSAGTRDDAGNRAPPTRVYCPKSSRRSTHEDDRQTIRRPHSDQ